MGGARGETLDWSHPWTLDELVLTLKHPTRVLKHPTRVLRISRWKFRKESPIRPRPVFWVSLLAVAWLTAAPVQSLGSGPRVDVQIVTDQVDAALRILEQYGSGNEVTETEWEALWESTGYRRLAVRQASFGDENTQQRLKEFLSSADALELLPRLRQAAADWKAMDVAVAAELVAAYTPQGLPLRATVFPVIKQQPNSFVVDLDSDPAVFMYVGEEVTPEQLTNTLAHELHHVGTAGCPDPADHDSRGPEVRRVIDWLSAFGEGIAVLAAAGGPDVHPHANSPSNQWVVWERDIANFNHDLARIETFFQGILDGTIPDDTQRAQLFTFINTDEVPQGAFYTVGWKMAALIEREYGREILVAAICDPRQLLSRYNAVVAEYPRDEGAGLARWSPGFLRALE